MFNVAPPLPDPLSQHWSTQLLLQLPPEKTFVRLDPLIVVPVDEHRERLAKMWVYGRDLDWDRIATLRGEEAARWMPDDLTHSGCAFTDVIWSRRDDGDAKGGGGVDKFRFRIKIWDKETGNTVYDNAPGASTDIDSASPQQIGGGSIVIQSSK